MRDVSGGFPVYYIFNHDNDTGFISSCDMNVLFVISLENNESRIGLCCPFFLFIRKWHI
ncbi:hypothetical protein CN941_20950 [Bacillus cereus]|nr:hypothetical protein COM83_17310 [Bacillus cereus]PEA18154.1 hypothetical protein CON40_26090 [Bacillus cereus]PEA28927.1 hypothetical protein CON44_01925 [Bacillus cereus]PEB83347.1 hypothetical protein COM95_01810 [Bacillus cereus]PEE19276.1 hypothetical protein CON53_04345 [Bacillus cereus]